MSFKNHFSIKSLLLTLSFSCSTHFLHAATNPNAPGTAKKLVSTITLAASTLLRDDETAHSPNMSDNELNTVPSPHITSEEMEGYQSNTHEKK